MRLIDGDAVYAKINKLRDADKLNGYELILLDTVLAAIKFSDTVDAVKHGHWSQYAEPHEDGKGLYICSVCNEMYVMHDDEYKFCPSCGAKMDGDKNDYSRV